jgi:hypothetical protein
VVRRPVADSQSRATLLCIVRILLCRRARRRLLAEGWHLAAGGGLVKTWNSSQLGLMPGTTDGQVLKWNAGSGAWELGSTSGVGSVTSTEILDGTITNADISPTAAIDATKIAEVWVNSAGDTMTGALLMGGNLIRDVADPAVAQDAATKNYVDTKAWSLTGNAGTSPGTNFIGTTDNQAFEVKVNSLRALRIEPTTANDAPNIIAGHGSNSVTAGAVGATIGGGGYNDGATVYPNRVTDHYGTVAGGYNNRAGNDDADPGNVWWATVGGGIHNPASGHASTVGGGGGNAANGSRSTVGGGYINSASGNLSTVGGGENNTAQGDYSFAAGNRAKANHRGAFVWAFDFASTAVNEWSARCTGGARFVTAIDGSGKPTAGVSLAPGATSWGTISDRDRKKGFRDVDGEDVLSRLAALPVTTWNYAWEEDGSVRHMGPMAQDFHAAFGLGADDKVITTQEADGVAFATLKALEARTAALMAENAATKAAIEALRAENESLRARLDALEKPQAAAPRK